MALTKENFVVDAKGNKVGVFLPIKQYNKILEDLEELDDIRMYDEVKKRKEESIPLEEYLELRRKRRMPKYLVTITKTAQKQLDKLPDNIADSLIDVIAELANNPRPNGCKKLKGRIGYRVRSGNFRIIYDIQDKILSIQVIAVGNKKRHLRLNDFN